MKILVVDDETLIRDVISMMLHNLGHEVQTASSGHDAMRTLERDLDIEVILTDVNCPSEPGSGDDGIWLAEKFNRIFSGRAKTTPLFFMTGGLKDGQEEKMRTLTLNPIIHKP